MKRMHGMVAVLAGVALTSGTWLRAATPAEPDLAAAVENVQKAGEMIAGKTAAEAADMAGKLLKAALGMGGDEAVMKARIARLVAACIGAAGDNAAAVAAALVKAGGSANVGVVVAAIAEAAKAVGADVAVVTKAAVDAAAEADKATANDAVADPAKYLGSKLAWVVGNVAKRWAQGGDGTVTTTTTTTTTTVPSPTPVGSL